MIMSTSGADTSQHAADAPCITHHRSAAPIILCVLSQRLAAPLYPTYTAHIHRTAAHVLHVHKRFVSPLLSILTAFPVHALYEPGPAAFSSIRSQLAVTSSRKQQQLRRRRVLGKRVADWRSHHGLVWQSAHDKGPGATRGLHQHLPAPPHAPGGVVGPDSRGMSGLAHHSSVNRDAGRLRKAAFSSQNSTLYHLRQPLVKPQSCSSLPMGFCWRCRWPGRCTCNNHNRYAR